VHRLHHLSVAPNHFTALSFHPVEAILQALYLPLIVFLLPVYTPVFIFFIYYSSFLMNIVGHCGYEIFPESFSRTWLGRISNTPAYHDNHHLYGKGNYGLYTPIWDRLMGTIQTPKAHAKSSKSEQKCLK
jgi:sterol desaturase/sphingolipid hydroxylase (fatty acid hydroxylase superfamily)